MSSSTVAKEVPEDGFKNQKPVQGVLAFCQPNLHSVTEQLGAWFQTTLCNCRRVVEPFDWMDSCKCFPVSQKQALHDVVCVLS